MAPVKKEFVEYSGPADIRTISAAQFKGAGVDGQKSVVWNASNGRRVPVEEFNDAARDLVLKDRAFKIIQTEG